MAVTQVEVEDVSLPVGRSARVMVRIFRAADAPQPAPVVLYLHQAAAGLGGDASHDGRARAIAADARAAVIVPRPEPDAGRQDVEWLHEILCWIAEQGRRRWLDGTRIELVWTTSTDPDAWHRAGRFLSAALHTEHDGTG